MSPDDVTVPGGTGGRPCPICGRPAAATLRPFCSQRCAMIDLGRWLGGDYRVPAEERPEGSDEENEPDRGGGGR